MMNKLNHNVRRKLFQGSWSFFYIIIIMELLAANLLFSEPYKILICVDNWASLVNDCF